MLTEGCHTGSLTALREAATPSVTQLNSRQIKPEVDLGPKDRMAMLREIKCTGNSFKALNLARTRKWF